MGKPNQVTEAVRRRARLFRLAKAEFGGPLTKAEMVLFYASAKGIFANFTSLGDKKNPPEDKDANQDRLIRGDRIAWLCANPKAQECLTHMGVQVKGAYIEGTINLLFAQAPINIALVACAMPDGMVLTNAEVVRALYLNGSHCGPIQADGLRVKGTVSLQGIQAQGEVRFLGADIGGNLDCTGATFTNQGKDAKALNADKLHVKGAVSLRGIQALGEVRFLGADIGSNLECTGATFTNPDENASALSADGLRVKGDIFLQGVQAQGEVRFLGADIDGDLSCSDAILYNPSGDALSTDRLHIKGGIFLRGVQAQGEVRFMGADIGGNFDCVGATFTNQGQDAKALNADGVSVKGNVFLRGVQTRGEVRFLGADIGGDLSCTGTTFTNTGQDAKALNADRLHVKGSVFLNDGFSSTGKVIFLGAEIGVDLDCSKGTFHGEVFLLGANIGGNLECNGATMDNVGGHALSTDRMHVKGGVFLQGVKAQGEIRFLGADIGGNLECDGATFTNQGRDAKALSADGLTVKGGVFLRRAQTQGEVRFLGADIGGTLECDGAAMDNAGGHALRADGLHVKGSVFIQDGFSSQGLLDFINAKVESYFIVSKINQPEHFALSLQSASIGHLCFSKDSWPAMGNLILDGLTYERLDDMDGVMPEERLEWIRLQPTRKPGDFPFYSGIFFPQPYKQLAKALINGGYIEEAKNVLIAKEKDYYKYRQLSERAWLKYHSFNISIGFGYRPFRALSCMLVAIFIGAIIFQIANGAMIRSKHFSLESQDGAINELTLKNYTNFYPLWYATDIFIPLVDLHIEDYWKPNPSFQWTILRAGNDHWYLTGTVLYCFIQLYTLLGWVLTTLFVVGLTGLVRGDPSRE